MRSFQVHQLDSRDSLPLRPRRDFLRGSRPIAAVRSPALSVSLSIAPAACGGDSGRLLAPRACPRPERLRKSGAVYLLTSSRFRRRVRPRPRCGNSGVHLRRLGGSRAAMAALSWSEPESGYCCVSCGGGISQLLARLGSVHCHDCRHGSGNRVLGSWTRPTGKPSARRRSLTARSRQR